jgi:hypothetical protein
MIPLEKVPKSGQFIIAINFKNYNDYYANETRLTLKNLPNRKDTKAIGLELYPLDYWLKRTVISKENMEETDDLKNVAGRTKATGGLYRIGFMNMTSDKFIELSKLLLKMKKTYWDEIEILIADQVEVI